jgi:hypothetical protein
MNILLLLTKIENKFENNTLDINNFQYNFILFSIFSFYPD